MGFSSQNADGNEEVDEYEESENNILNINDKNQKNEILSDEEKYKKELHNKIIQQRKNMINKLENEYNGINYDKTGNNFKK